MFEGENARSLPISMVGGGGEGSRDIKINNLGTRKNANRENGEELRTPSACTASAFTPANQSSPGSGTTNQRRARSVLRSDGGKTVVLK